MQLGLGVLGWPPGAFWEASFAELFAALEGFSEKNGAGRSGALKRGDIDHLRRMMADHERPA